MLSIDCYIIQTLVQLNDFAFPFHDLWKTIVNLWGISCRLFTIISAVANNFCLIKCGKIFATLFVSWECCWISLYLLEPMIHCHKLIICKSLACILIICTCISNANLLFYLFQDNDPCNGGLMLTTTTGSVTYPGIDTYGLDCIWHVRVGNGRVCFSLYISY